MTAAVTSLQLLQKSESLLLKNLSHLFDISKTIRLFIFILQELLITKQNIIFSFVNMTKMYTMCTYTMG